MQKTLVTTPLHPRASPTGIHTNPFYAGTHNVWMKCIWGNKHAMNRSTVSDHFHIACGGANTCTCTDIHALDMVHMASVKKKVTGLKHPPKVPQECTSNIQSS